MIPGKKRAFPINARDAPLGGHDSQNPRDHLRAVGNEDDLWPLMRYQFIRSGCDAAQVLAPDGLHKHRVGPHIVDGKAVSRKIDEIEGKTEPIAKGEI
ncbi:hypothetical protein [Rhizobium sp. BK376]|uniref:hypothetical protein n=1 Tax=Rhizobium sp. BK376 TaxID=2512149 RepID=UPI0014045EED|nr:hypothetical protein [Rhizobium sp. BK376]